MTAERPQRNFMEAPQNNPYIILNNKNPLILLEAPQFDKFPYCLFRLPYCIEIKYRGYN